MTIEKYIEIKHKKHSNLIDEIRVKRYNKNLCKKYPFLIPTNRWTGVRITDKTHPFFGGEDSSVKDNPSYHYEYTELDSMPDGWRLVFGNQMIEELRQELEKFNYLDKYQITQIKEKYGTLRWYDNGIPVGHLSPDYEVYEKKQEESFPKDWLDKNIHYRYIETKNSKPVFSEGLSKEVVEENLKYNREHAVSVYHKHRVIEHCKIYEIIQKYEKLSKQTCIECGKSSRYQTKGWIRYICEDCAKKRFKENQKRNSSEEHSFEDFFYEMEEVK